MICPNCKTDNRDHAKFCDQCGFPLSGLIAQAAIEANEANIPLRRHDEQDQREDDVQSGIPDNIESETTDVAETEEPAASDDDVAPVVSDVEEAEETETPSDDDEPAAAVNELDPTEAIDPLAEDAEDLEATAVIELPNLDDDAEKIATKAAAAADDPMITAVIPPTKAVGDLSGLDESVYDEFNERLASSDYEAPTPSWRDGSTMQLPRVEGEEPQKNKSYRAKGPADKTKSKTARTVVGIVVIVAIAVAAATYGMELWGGKSIPNVVGYTQADASSVLQERGFSVRATKVKSDDTEGLVLIMDPASGARAPEGSEVVIHISVARYIPDVVGKSEQEARDALAGEGFENVSFVKERSTQPEGTVLSITPAPGEGAKSGAPITVKISDPFRVPDVKGMYLEDAMNAMEQAGLSGYIKNYYTEDQAEGYIVGTEPQVGTVLEEGSSVAILITRSRANELVAATQAYLAAGNTVTIGGYNWVISEMSSATYLGNNMVSYSIVGTPMMSTELGTAYFSSQPYSGVITWSEDNAVIGIS